MVFALLYSWLRLFLDLVDLRLGARDAEAELLLLRHQLRVVRRQVKKPRLEPADRAIMSALSRFVSRAALSGILVQPETVLGGCCVDTQRSPLWWRCDPARDE